MMLFSSSKRACSSISTATCLPRSAACASIRAMLRVAAGAVQRQLDGQDVGILGRGLDEPLDRRGEPS